MCVRRMRDTLHTCSNPRQAKLLQAAENCCQPSQLQSLCRKSNVVAYPRPYLAGVPGVLAALVLAFLSNLFGSITHYGSGQVRSFGM